MKRRELFLLLGIAAIAVFWRVNFISHLKNNFIFFILPGSDSLHYHIWAKRIMEQGAFYTSGFFGMPLYAYFLAFIYKIFSINLWALRVIQLSMGVVNCWLVYLIAKRLFNPKVGILAAILMSNYLMFAFYEILPTPTALIIFLNSLLFLSFLEAADNPSGKSFLLLGVLLGFVSLAEPGILLFALGIIISFFCYFKQAPLRRLCIFSSMVFLGIFLILSLNTLRNYLINKDFIPISAHSGINFYIGNNPGAPGTGEMPYFLRPSQKGHLEDATLVAEEMTKRSLKPSGVSRFWFGQSLKFLRYQPLNFIKLQAKKFWLFWRGTEPVDTVEFSFLENNHFFMFLLMNSFGLISSLCLLGMVLALREHRKIFSLFIFVLSQMLAVVLFFVTTRYRLVIVPFMIIFSAYSLYWFYLQLSQKRIRKFIYGFVGFLVLSGFISYKGANAPLFSADLYANKHYNLGVLKQEQGQIKDAIVELETAVKLNPLDYVSHFALGNAYYAAKEIKLASQEYKIALNINPKFTDGHFNLGHLYLNSGKLTEAEKEFKEVLKLIPGSVDAYFQLGNIYKSQKKYKEAIDNFQKIAKFDPYYSAAVSPLIEECRQLAGKK